MASANRYPGLSKGPIDTGDRGSIITNEISGGAIEMGAVVKYDTIAASQLIPSVVITTTQGLRGAIGIAVDGANDGVYGTGAAATDDTTKATTASGQAVAILKFGRAPCKVLGAVLAIGDGLTPSDTDGYLEKGLAGDFIVAKALSVKANTDLDIIAVEFNLDGVFA